MSDSFDPYHRWLGIAPDEQPADHYRLLGLRVFESDPEVIESAADRQMKHLRDRQIGKYADQSQRLLNEVSAARLVLLNAEKRAAYDAQLRAKLEQPARERKLRPVPVAPLGATMPQTSGPSPATPVPSGPLSTLVHALGKRRNSRWPTPGLYAAAGAAVLLFIIGAFVLRGMKQEEARPTLAAVNAIQPDGNSDAALSRNANHLPEVPPTAASDAEPLDKLSPTPQQAPPPAVSRTQIPVAPPPLAVAPFDAQQAAEHQQAWVRHLGNAVEVTNSIGMKLALIPPGEFLMGSPVDEADRKSEERQHRVQITQPFYLGVYEVTQGEYQRVMGRNPSHFRSVPGHDTSRFPVEKISWEDALEFCRKLSALSSEKSSGRVYRLPTEAEWEYACRAGTTTPFHFGSWLNGHEANCNGNSPYGTRELGTNLQRPTTVGSYTSNAFGLYDMHGNIWEWCSDWYDGDYDLGPSVNDPRGPATGSSRVVRGGGWFNVPRDCRSAIRFSFPPWHRRDAVGFRVACVPMEEARSGSVFSRN